MAYHRFIDDTGAPYGSFEVFYVDRAHAAEHPEEFPGGAGWYFWPCFPGCIPDGEAWGVFPSEQAAIDAARDNF